MIARNVICDLCMKPCEKGIWYQIYTYSGDYYTGKMIAMKEVCNECFGKIWERMKEGDEK